MVSKRKAHSGRGIGECGVGVGETLDRAAGAGLDLGGIVEILAPRISECDLIWT